MKKLNTLGLIFTLIMIFFGCEVEDKDPAGQRNVASVPVISDINPGIFDSKDLQNAYVQFVVSLDPASQAEKIEILGSFAGNLERVMIKEVTKFPDTVRITSAEAAEKLGLELDSVGNGEVFTFELLTTENGLKTRSNAVLIASVACGFDPLQATGDYHSISADWNSEGDITITADPDDPFTVYVAGLVSIEGENEDQGPLVMHIDPATFAVVADKTILASSAFGYTNLAYEGSGTFNSCDGSYTMNFDISVDQGNFGRFLFNFTRNPL